MFSALSTRDYRLLWIGQGISHLGDQFHLIALPWLVLTLTHDPFQLGLVLALAGVPRAAVMLLGGAFADRHSPRLIMLISDLLRLVITAALAASILTGTCSSGWCTGWPLVRRRIGVLHAGGGGDAAAAAAQRPARGRQRAHDGRRPARELRRAGARRLRHRRSSARRTSPAARPAASPVSASPSASTRPRSPSPR